MNRRVIGALLRKELLDVSRNRGALLPVVLVTAIALVVPFVVTIVVPSAIGQRLSDDADLVRASLIIDPGGTLTLDGRVQLFFYQQFLLLFLLTPTTGAMAMAAHSVVGEKLARTLEPLLATPIATFELLLAKVLGALVPTLVIAMAGLSLYMAGVALFAMPGSSRRSPTRDVTRWSSGSCVRMELCAGYRSGRMAKGRPKGQSLACWAFRWM